MSLSSTDVKAEECQPLLAPDMEEKQSAEEKLGQACPIPSPLAGHIPRGNSPATDTSIPLLFHTLQLLIAKYALMFSEHVESHCL